MRPSHRSHWWVVLCILPRYKAFWLSPYLNKRHIIFIYRVMTFFFLFEGIFRWNSIHIFFYFFGLSTNRISNDNNVLLVKCTCSSKTRRRSYFKKSPITFHETQWNGTIIFVYSLIYLTYHGISSIQTCHDKLNELMAEKKSSLYQSSVSVCLNWYSRVLNIAIVIKYSHLCTLHIVIFIFTSFLIQQQ